MQCLPGGLAAKVTEEFPGLPNDIFGDLLDGTEERNSDLVVFNFCRSRNQKSG